MEYRPLGRTGVKVSPLCLGCMNFGASTPADDATRIIDRALDEGVNFLDTANVYARGLSEEITGEALRRNGKRQRVVLATKVYGRVAEDDVNAMGGSRRHIIEQCEASLIRLRTDYIDLYQMHRPDPNVPIDETLRALDDLVRSGKVRYIGTSTFAAWQIVESLWVSKELGLNRFVTDQSPYNLLDRRAERELAPMAQTFGIALNPWSPLGGGLLTGKYKRGKAPGKETRYGSPGSERWRSRLVDSLYDTLDCLEPLAAAKDCTMAQFSMAWLMAQPGVVAPIAGPRTMDHLNDYLDALKVAISPEDCAAVDAIVPPGAHASPFYAGPWGPHTYRV
ncbi:MAG TPA: aldo/keto reductase [Chloroflexota bacterium]|nr:aldo/keto reductase [Chloroflexota bacterium]